MTDENDLELQELRTRYMIAVHAMQAGVGVRAESDYDNFDLTPKHLRVGVNSALVDSCAIAELLIKKGLITEKEYLEALATGMEREVTKYQKELEERFGVKIKFL